MERDTNTAPLNPLFWDYLVAVNDAINSVTIPANKAKYPKLDKTVTTSTY